MTNAVKVKPTKKNAQIAIKMLKQFFKEYEAQTYTNSSIKVMQNELASGQTQLIVDGKRAVGVVNFDGRGKGNGVAYWTINSFYLLKGYRGKGIGTAIRNQLCKSKIDNLPVVGTVITAKRFRDRVAYWHNNGFKYFMKALPTTDGSDNSLIMLWKFSPFADYTPTAKIENLLLEEAA